MIQNIIALIIVFAAVGYTFYSIIKNLTAKNVSNCGGCSGCSLKDLPMVKHHKVSENSDFKSFKLSI